MDDSFKTLLSPRAIIIHTGGADGKGRGRVCQPADAACSAACGCWGLRTAAAQAAVTVAEAQFDPLAVDDYASLPQAGEQIIAVLANDQEGSSVQLFVFATGAVTVEVEPRFFIHLPFVFRQVVRVDHRPEPPRNSFVDVMNLNTAGING